MRWPEAWAVGLGLALAPVVRAEPPAIVQQEVNYLLRYIGDSGCEFKRNDNWYNAKSAEVHIRGKYNFLVTLGMIDTTQDFIDKAATKSSLSDQPYEIRCGRGASVPSSIWLRNELARYRASQ